MSKLTKVINIYYNDERKSHYQSGLVIELEDGRILSHAQDGFVMPFEPAELSTKKEEE